MERMSEQQLQIYRKLLRPAYRMYRDVERNGLYLDLNGLKDVRRKYLQEEQNLLHELKTHYDINWNRRRL